MALRNMRFEGDDILRKKSRPVERFNHKLQILLDDMAETLYDRDGVGLAAPQVGVLRRVVVIDIGEGIMELVNPEILETSGTQCHPEGCLSVPGKAGLVERPAYVKLRACNRNGEPYIIEGQELLAVALMHEIEHLDGILYIDKVIEFVDLEQESDADEDTAETDEPDGNLKDQPGEARA